MTATTTQNAYDLLADRGMIAQQTHEDLRRRLETPVVVYNGFDPTADSLHVGHLVPIMGLAWLQRCGHKPIAVVGGATALVGDPSGKSEARKMLTLEQVDANAAAIKAQLERFIRFADAPDGGVLLNNADWLRSKGWIEMLREVGPHFSVNRMLTMDSVKGRMTGEGEGISFLEFNYMVMQAYDFLHLARERNCTLQTGGQDQWGNIIMGMELGRRVAGRELMGLTFPLVTKSDGTKFGKTESGAVWLDPQRTSPYAFYQFFRNTADADVGKYLGYFTFLPADEVKRLAALEGQAVNEAKEVLAYEVTKVVHGEPAAEQARADSRKAFSAQADVTGESIPHASITPDELGDIRDLLVRAGLTSSKSEAKKLIQGGGVRLGDEKVSDIARVVTPADATDGYVLLRVGKKKIFRFDLGE